MAAISSGGVTLPSWFLTVATAAFLTATGATIKLVWGLDETVAADHGQIIRNTDDITRLNNIVLDVVTMKADVAAIKRAADRTEDKVDRLTEHEAGRRRP